MSGKHDRQRLLANVALFSACTERHKQRHEMIVFRMGLRRVGRKSTIFQQIIHAPFAQRAIDPIGEITHPLPFRRIDAA